LYALCVNPKPHLCVKFLLFTLLKFNSFMEGMPGRMHHCLATSPNDRAKYCNEYVCLCLSVCLSARITRKPHGRTTPIFVHVACGVARSSFDGIVMRYVLPVLWMTSWFHIMVNGALCVFLSSYRTRQV